MGREFHFSAGPNEVKLLTGSGNPDPTDLSKERWWPGVPRFHKVLTLSEARDG
jgi:hypothetical protein